MTEFEFELEQWMVKLSELLVNFYNGTNISDYPHLTNGWFAEDVMDNFKRELREMINEGKISSAEAEKLWEKISSIDAEVAAAKIKSIMAMSTTYKLNRQVEFLYLEF